MKRRSRAGGKPAKARPRKALTAKGRKASKAVTRRGSPPGAHAEVARLTRELKEAQEQQTATSEVLRVISGSPGDLKPVFNAMLEKAVRICDAKFGTMYLCDGGKLRLIAAHNVPTAFEEVRGDGPLTPAPDGIFDKVIKTGTTVHLLDLAATKLYAERHPRVVEAVELGGIRTVVGVPMLKDNQLIGIVNIHRREVRPFTDEQIALVTNFAAQAVIAIENARLFNELRQRTVELTESLEQQTATANVLRVISSSSTDIQPVLDTIVRTAGELCASEYAALFKLQDGNYHAAAWNNAAAEWAKYHSEHPIRVDRGSLVGRTALERSAIHIVHCLADPEYAMHEAARLGRQRSMLGVPLLHNGIPIGVIGLLRTVVKPFTEKQIELVTAFADQAVIAIENARLFSELRQRTADLTERTTDLTEALEQQTATSEVLQVISSSPGDLEPVFAAMLEKAVRICDAKYGTLYLRDGDTLRLVAAHDVPEFFAARRGVAFEPAPGGGLDVVMRTKRAAQVPDLAATTAYKERHAGMVEAVELAGIRTGMAVPMLKEDELIGIVAIHRREVLLFTDKQLALITNFAAQAVIAIENARLLNELRESLQQQTATSEVLQVISSSPGDLEPVFATMLENAVRICDAKFGNIYRWDGDALHLLATHNTPLAYAEARRRSPVRPNPNNIFGRMVATKTVVHVPDAAELREQGNPEYVTAVELGGVRTCLAVPMLKEHELVGSISLFRQEILPFTDKQIALITNFASQAVIAIENARLLKELRERTGELEVQSREVVELNQRLEQRVADQVGEIERMSRLRRFLPPQVADLIVASGAEKQLESHRREITALFCDLRGFTGFSESSDPEDVMALLREYHAAIGEIIVRYSGTLERYAGDGVMVIFNDPVPVENPALQAVLMALEMRDAIGALTEKWRRLGHDIGFGIGVAHGFATLGTIGFEGRFDYAAIGTVSNVASRLCDEAKAGQILISPRVLMAVEDAVKVEPVGEFELKGIRRPIAACNVLAAKSAN
jgi:GAF domain-containing protein